MATKDDYKRVQKAMTRGEEIDPADDEVLRRYLESRAIYGRQRLITDVVLVLLCLAAVITLAIIGDSRLGHYALPALAALAGLPSLRRHYRIRRWCDQHPDIAYALYEPRRTR